MEDLHCAQVQHTELAGTHYQFDFPEYKDKGMLTVLSIAGRADPDADILGTNGAEAWSQLDNLQGVSSSSSPAAQSRLSWMRSRARGMNEREPLRDATRKGF